MEEVGEKFFYGEGNVQCWGAVPLIPLDVFEHAYYHKDGPARAMFIDNCIANSHWGRINERYKKFVLVKQTVLRTLLLVHKNPICTPR